MARTNITQKQCEVHQRDRLVSMVSLECTRLELSYIVKTMIRIIKIKTKDSMNKETREQFSNITDAVVQMVDEIKK